MGAYSKHSIHAHSPNVATVRLNLRMGPLKGFPSPTWCQGSKTTGQIWDSHPSSCHCWVSYPPTRAPHICGSPSELLGPGQEAPPNLSPAPSTFHSLTNRRKPAEQLIFMNRNSIRRRFLWAWGGVRRRRRAQKGRFITSRGREPLSPCGAGAAFIVLTICVSRAIVPLSLPLPVPVPARGGLREEG